MSANKHAVGCGVPRTCTSREKIVDRFQPFHWRPTRHSLLCVKSVNNLGLMPVVAAENNTRVGLVRSMVSAGARGGLGTEPPAGVQGAEPPVGVRGQRPPETDGILVLEHTFLRSPGDFLLICTVTSHFVQHAMMLGLSTVPEWP